MMTQDFSSTQRISPLVSIIIVNFNYGRYLPDAVETSLQQDMGPGELEVIVVDDGSTDDSVANMRPYLDRIQLFTQPNKGQVAAFNHGFSKARGKYIALLESDDTWHKDKIRRTIEVLKKNPKAALVQHWLRQTDMAGHPIEGFQYPPGPTEFSLDDVLWGRLISTGSSALVFRADAVRPFMPLPETMRYGADMCLRAIAVTLGPLLNIPEVLGLRRIHNQNAFGVSMYETPEKLEVQSAVHAPMMKFYHELSDRQKVPFNPEFFRLSELELIQMQLFLHRYRGHVITAIGDWFRLLKLAGFSRYSAFKGLTLLLAIASPHFYLSLHRYYSQARSISKLREAFFPSVPS